MAHIALPTIISLLGVAADRQKRNGVGLRPPPRRLRLPTLLAPPPLRCAATRDILPSPNGWGCLSIGAAAALPTSAAKTLSRFARNCSNEADPTILFQMSASAVADHS